MNGYFVYLGEMKRICPKDKVQYIPEPTRRRLQVYIPSELMAKKHNFWINIMEKVAEIIRLREEKPVKSRIELFRGYTSLLQDTVEPAV